MFRHAVEYVGLFIALAAYTAIVLRIGFSWGDREKSLRGSAPRPSPHRSPGRHAARPPEPPPLPVLPPVQAPEPVPVVPLSPSLSLLVRVRDALRGMNADDEPEEERDPEEARVPDETSEMTAIIPVPEEIGQ